jgi:hypothetical protein
MQTPSGPHDALRRSIRGSGSEVLKTFLNDHADILRKIDHRARSHNQPKRTVKFRALYPFMVPSGPRVARYGSTAHFSSINLYFLLLVLYLLLLIPSGRMSTTLQYRKSVLLHTGPPRYPCQSGTLARAQLRIRSREASRCDGAVRWCYQSSHVLHSMNPL